MSLKLLEDGTRDDVLGLIAQGVRVREAVKAAGYAHSFASFRPTLHDPKSVQFIRDNMKTILETQLSPRALRIAGEMLEDTKTSDKVRWDIAKAFLSTTRIITTHKAETLDKPPTDISQMTGAEIAAFRQRLEREQALRSNGAKIIDATPLSEQELDLM